MGPHLAGSRPDVLSLGLGGGLGRAGPLVLGVGAAADLCRETLFYTKSFKSPE